jgi:hypothetical protein
LGNTAVLNDSRCRRDRLVPNIKLRQRGVWLPTWGMLSASRSSGYAANHDPCVARPSLQIGSDLRLALARGGGRICHCALDCEERPAGAIASRLRTSV